MKMEYTPEQKNAIYDRSGTLIVSAGAGSGKTSILTKRIIERISDEKDPCEIEDLLVVTFTKAAAKEMRERIESALGEKIADDPSNKKAMRQLAKIGLAHISTIDSFCFETVKQNFQNLSLPPKLKIIDESESKILKDRILNQIFEEKYEEEPEDSDFYKFIETFSDGKSDAKCIETVSAIYDKTRNLPEPEKYLDSTVEKYTEVELCKEYFDTDFGKMSYECALTELENAIFDMKEQSSQIRYEEAVCKYCAAFDADAENLENILCALKEKNYENFRRKLLDYNTKTFSAIKDYEDKEYLKNIKLVKENANKKVKGMRERLFLADTTQLKKCARDCKTILVRLISILKELDVRFLDEKKARGVVDFTDTEQYTKKLFVKNTGLYGGSFEPTDTAREYGERFLEIYIDEYQDVNPIQDMIFRAICRTDERKLEEINRFLVGDVKQSIYRFRGARPELFEDICARAVRLSEKSAENTFVHKEYLSNNFRCSENVVKFTNAVFSKIMCENYSDDEKLVYSRREKSKVADPCEILFYEDDDVQDDYYENEIKVIADRIKHMVHNKDILSGDGKMYDYKDFAVIMRSTKNVADRYARYLEKNGIPASADIPDNFFENPEILLMLSILNAIDNPLRDIYTAGAMRSEVYLFSDDDLCKLRRLNPQITSDKVTVWKSVNDFASSSSDDTELKNKCANFAESINYFRKLSRGTPCDKLILEIYNRCNILNICSGKSFNRYDGIAEKRRANLAVLYNMAKNFEKSYFRGLCSFLKELTYKKNDGGKIPVFYGNSDNYVKIMSIHHSKGLEFPVCFISGLHRDFNIKEENENIFFSDVYGIGFKIRDIKSLDSVNTNSGFISIDTPFRNAVRAAEKKSFRDEEKRILYVAMTRAKDRLFMTFKNLSEFDAMKYFRHAQLPGGRISEFARGLYDFVLCSAFTSESIRDVYSCSNMPPVSEELSKDVLKCSHVIGRSENVISKTEEKPLKESFLSTDYTEKIEEFLNFEYKNDLDTKIPSKITVSSLKYGLLDEEQKKKTELIKPDFLTDGEDEKLTSAERGTAMHIFMQFANYKNCEISVEKESERLYKQSFLSEIQYKNLDFGKLSEFFRSGLYSDISESKNVFREVRFNLKVSPNELMHEKREPAPESFVLVQGVIDCFFENHDGTYSVVDFKTDRVSENGEEILKQRHSEQILYYKKAVESMTGKKVSRCVLYSFALSKEIEV